MDFETYSERLATLQEYCFNNKPKKRAKKNSVSKRIRQVQFAGLSDESFYFHDGIVPIPF